MARNKVPFRLRIRCQERDDADASTSQKKKRKQKNNKDNSCTRRSKRQKHQKDLNNTATSTTCSRNDQNHLMASSNNTGKKKSRTQNWRDKLKEKDAKKYDKIKASSRMYSQCYRINMALAERTLSIGDGVCSNSMYVDDWKLVDLRDERNSDVTSEDNVEADQSGDHGGNGDIGPDDDADHDEDDDVGEDDYTGTDDAHGDDEQNGEDGHGNKPITGLTNGKFVAVRFTSQQRNLIYLAMITDIPEGGVILKFLRYNSKEDYYYFTAEKEHTHPVEDIIAVLKEPAMSTVKRAYVYKFCPQELELIAEREQADLK